ncbi:Na(+)/Li(+)-exporting P-type ATPase [Eremomyces bilateralis CBS 781.70]|uniref:P-type Na(+) transporter n=1 Tax=Eremomyces bilateralis CBS 781.70 TaxID=1392243 RepID=A0A6G1G1R3_9PEZI|nr:Na(+)/Li(+)-exporting P-type ATPase [Eremomyces bilateralis CBS 781.70]KAF1811994.1 Na(+)/Li(+)-exporting P-type ATPase [Eremomyces bilateralis CBS 781.70]
MAVSFGIKSWIEGGVIGAVIILNITIGFFQEFKAEKTMDSLRSLSSPTAMTVRAGKASTIPTVEVVPGDLVEVKTGDTIPADLRLLEAVNFETDEALLTGESLPVRKESLATFDVETGPGDRLNVAYSSSTVTKGRATGIVFATGMYTEIGSIASALNKKESRRRPVKRNQSGQAGPHRYMQAYSMTAFDAVGRFLGVNVGTPLQKKLSRLAVLLFGTAILCAIIVLAANKFSNRKEVIIYAVATGVSMLPASLVVLLTITMAAGTKRMVERNVIVRNLRSLEALGAVTDICSDKTGTLTQGKMVTKKVWIPARGTYSVGVCKEPFNPTVGDLSLNKSEPRNIDFKGLDEKDAVAEPADHLIQDNPYLQDFLNVASLANLSHVHTNAEGGWTARGDPTEIAMLVFASRFNWGRDRWTKGADPKWKSIAEFPFDSSVKKMSTLCTELETGEHHLFTKGAVERIIDSCSKCFWEEGAEPIDMTDELRDHVIKNMDSLSALGLRVLALASKKWTQPVENVMDMDRQKVEVGLTFRGLVAIYDPPRPESRPSVRQCQEAGITVHMLTGDHPGTARAIALEVGILPSHMERLSKEVADAMIMTAAQFDKLSDTEVDALPTLPLVVARCAPNTKVRMIEALHRRKRFCAMTGDGVNDSPSLKRADVGIAMGQSGSDVAKDASDIVLTDDNFASILNAIEEGRRMFDNIQRFVLHILAENIAQACVLLIGLAFKDGSKLSVFPISPVEALWIIMVTSGMPDMGLGFEEAVPEIMQRPPMSLKAGVFTLEVMLDMFVYGLWIAALCLGAFSIVVFGFGDGNLGENCNNDYANAQGVPVCDLVFRGRATTFACLTWNALFLAWQMVDMRRSFFRMHPGSKRPFTQWIVDVWRNKFLFWAIIIGFVTLFPTLYIPVINHKVFRHEGLTWEWAVVFIETFLFFIGVEIWLWCKRVYFRHAGKGETLSGQDVEARAFGLNGTESTSSGTSDEEVPEEQNSKDLQKKATEAE